jgi:hypothetical protein
MDSDNHISLTDLINKLSDDLESVNSGDASKEKVQEMLALSRELHERLTVLRFKSFEAATNDDTLDVEESDEAQIDLIDSIKEVSLAEKHQQKPLSSVREGLTILERANYTSILFSNDDSSFNDMLDDVDLCSNVDDATQTFRGSINPNGRKEEVQLAMKTFEDRIPRIFS